MNRIPNSSMALIGGAMFAALLFGAALTLLPPIVVIGAIIVIAVVIFAARNPYIGLIAALVLVFEIVPADMQPGVPLGGSGKLTPYDVMVIFLALVVTMKSLGEKDLLKRALGPMLIPMVYLCVALVVSLVYVKYYAPNSTIKVAITEARGQFMWLLLPLIALGVDSKARFKYFVLGVVAIGFVLAAYVSAESLLGIHITSQARVEALDQRANSDVVRSIVGGIYVIIFTLMLGFNMLLDRRLSIWPALIGGGLLSMGIAVQYGRGIWVATIFGLAVSSFIYKGWRGLFITVALATLSVTLLLAGITATRPQVAEALIERAVGIGDEVQTGGSFGFRKTENANALVAIEKSPWFGVGLGGTYKRITSLAGFTDEARYIHNAYMYYPLKLGVWASLIPFTVIFAFFVIARRGLKAASGGENNRKTDRAFIGAVIGSYVVPIITSYTQPEWGNPQGIGSMCIFIGFAMLYLKFGSPFSSQSTDGPTPAVISANRSY